MAHELTSGKTQGADDDVFFVERGFFAKSALFFSSCRHPDSGKLTPH